MSDTAAAEPRPPPLTADVTACRGRRLREPLRKRKTPGASGISPRGNAAISTWGGKRLYFLKKKKVQIWWGDVGTSDQQSDEQSKGPMSLRKTTRHTDNFSSTTPPGKGCAMASLIILPKGGHADGSGIGKSFPLGGKGSKVTIGSGDKSDVRLKKAGVSELHCSISLVDDGSVSHLPWIFSAAGTGSRAGGRWRGKWCKTEGYYQFPTASCRFGNRKLRLLSPPLPSPRPSSPPTAACSSTVTSSSRARSRS